MRWDEIGEADGLNGLAGVQCDRCERSAGVRRGEQAGEIDVGAGNGGWDW